jgi:hypothetical protein
MFLARLRMTKYSPPSISWSRSCAIIGWPPICTCVNIFAHKFQTIKTFPF